MAGVDATVNTVQMREVAKNLDSIKGQLQAELASIESKVSAIKGSVNTLQSYNGAYVAGNKNLKRQAGTSPVGDDGGYYRIMYEVYSTIWKISGHENIASELDSISNKVAQKIKAICSGIDRSKASLNATADKIDDLEQGAAIDLNGSQKLNSKEFEDFFRKNIFYNKYDAASGKKSADVTGNTTPYWIDKNLEFVKQDNGTWLITKGGIAMGFTTSAAVEAYKKYKGQNSKSSNKSSGNSGTLSNKQMEELRQARKKEAEGRKIHQEAEARKIRAASSTATVAAATGVTISANGAKTVPDTDLMKEWKKKGLVSDKEPTDYFNLNKNNNKATKKTSTTYSKDDYLIEKAKQEQKAKANGAQTTTNSGTLSDKQMEELRQARIKEGEGRKAQAQQSTSTVTKNFGDNSGKPVPDTDLMKEWKKKGLVSDKESTDYFNLNKNNNKAAAKTNTTYSKDDYLIEKAKQEQKAKQTTASSGTLSDKQMEELRQARIKEGEGRKAQQAASAGIENSGAKEKIDKLGKGLPKNTNTKPINTTPQSTFSAKKISPTETAIDWAKKIANNDKIGYSQSVREGSSYDCSSLIINAYEKAGIPVKAAGATNTSNMINAFTKTGKFEYVSGNPNVNNLKPGDIVITPGSHTEMYVGNGKLLGAHDNFDGVAGDSSGKEINVKDYYGTWSGYLKYKGN